MVAAPLFVCETPEVDGPVIRLRYRCGEHHFTETVTLPAVAPESDESTLRLLAIAAGLSYFKAFAPAIYELDWDASYYEIAFAEQVSRHGLGEFAYVNDLADVLTTPVISTSRKEPRPRHRTHRWPTRRALVAVGGGKDSIVTLEALRNAGIEVTLFSVNEYAPITATAEASGLPYIKAKRTLDPALFELNASGAPNGHVPVTAINSLIALLTAHALGGIETVVFSNEASSSYGNVIWHGHEINHQWSKSLEFERLIRESLEGEAPDYVSFLRPLTELRIMRHFAGLTKYHSVFTSCNRAFHLDPTLRTSWCADCDKCRFVFLTLAPFISRDALLAIFSGRDMFANPEQLSGFLELLGAEGTLKPFECVGEPDECRVALDIIREHTDWQGHPFLALDEISAIHAAPGDRERVFAFKEGAHCLDPDLEAVARAVE